LDSTDIEALFEKGNALFDIGKYDEAIDDYDKVLDIDSTVIEALYNKGLALSKLGADDEAIDYFNEVLEINSTDIDGLFGKGIALYELEKYDEAIYYYDKVLEINSTHIDSLINKALIFMDTGKVQEAYSISSKLMESNPNNRYVLSLMGYISYKLEKYNDAALYYKKALDITPNLLLQLTNKEQFALDTTIEKILPMINNNTNNFHFFEKNGISIKYPISWKKEENLTRHNFGLFLTPISSNSSEVIALNKQRLVNISDTDPKAFDVYSFALINYINEKFSIISINYTEISNNSAYELVFNNDGKIADILWTYKDNYIYNIIFMGTKEINPFYLSIFKEIVNSFTIHNPKLFDFYHSILQDYSNLKNK